MHNSCKQQTAVYNKDIVLLTRTDTNLYASKTKTIVKKNRNIVMAKLAFLTKVHTGTPFLFPFTPSSDAMVSL